MGHWEHMLPLVQGNRSTAPPRGAEDQRVVPTSQTDWQTKQTFDLEKTAAFQTLAGRKRAAFTLIELLVVIGIIGILAGLLFPVLARAKERAKGTQCLSNLGQMQIAWNIYADDHQGTLPVNGSGSSAGKYADEPSWVAGYLSTGTSPDNTNTSMLIGQEYQKWGSIGGYTKNPDIYHCPADLSRDSGNGLSRVRSISMNSWINPGRNGEVSGRFWDLNFEKYTKITDFVRLSPSDGFVFLDERPDSINDGWFMVSMESYNPNDLAGLEVRDLPAIYHNRASSFTFADGHAEWVSSSQRPSGH